MSNSTVNECNNGTHCVQETVRECDSSKIPDVMESISTCSYIPSDHTYTMPSDTIPTSNLHPTSIRVNQRMSNAGRIVSTTERYVTINSIAPHIPSVANGRGSQDVVVRGLEIGSKFQISSRELPPGFSVADCRSFTATNTMQPKANGCLHNSFLDLNELIDILQSSSHLKCHSRIPMGVKNNVYFIVKSSEIVPSSHNSQRRTLADDCGSWVRNAGVSETFFIKSDSGKLEVVYMKEGKYGYLREIKGKLEITTLEQQPDVSQIIKLCRYNAHLKSDQSYKKRVSWIVNNSIERISIVEYLGKFPTIGDQGKRQIDIVWTSGTKLQEVSDRLEGKRKRASLSKKSKQRGLIIDAKKRRSDNDNIEAQETQKLYSNILFSQSIKNNDETMNSSVILGTRSTLAENTNKIADPPFHALANGTLEHTFLSFNDLLPLLQSDFSNCRQTIPTGIKSNVYFVVQKSFNSWERSLMERSFFPDDCGTWNGSGASSPITYFIKTESGEYRSALLKNKQHCFRRIIDGKTSYLAIEPQPEPSDVLKIRRYYTSLKVDPSYKKRVSWIDDGGIESIAVVEYLGKFPGISVFKTRTKDKPRKVKQKKLARIRDNSTQGYDASECHGKLTSSKSISNNSSRKSIALRTKSLPVWTLTDVERSTEFSSSSLMISKNDDFAVNETKHAQVNGRLKNSFLKLNDLVNILASCTFTEAHQSIPLGIKENVYYVVQNFANKYKRSCNEQSFFPDDCGPWNGCNAGSPHTFILKTDSGEFKSVQVQKGQFVIKRSMNGRTELLPLDPQPDPSQVMKLCRYCTTLKADPSYRKRVSWIETNSVKEECITVVEYLGKHPQKPTCGKHVDKLTKTTSHAAEGIGPPGSKRVCKENVARKSLELETNYLPVWTLEDCHMFTENKRDVPLNESTTFPEFETVCAQASGVLKNSFLSLEALIETLQNISHLVIYSSIPLGSKNNVYFLVQDSAKISQKCKQTPFIDDCGVWDVSSASCTKTRLMRTEAGGYKTMVLKNGVYVRRKETKGKLKYEVLVPQPEPSEVLVLSRHYSCLRGHPSYKKRISWLEIGSTDRINVVEYLGTFPGVTTDLNRKNTRAKKVEVKENDDTSSIDLNDFTEPPDVGLHMEDRSKKRGKDTEHLKLKHNIEAHILELEMSPAEVKTIVKKDQYTPFSIVIYSDDQIADIKSICCTRRSVFTVEKTFNFGDMFVTSTCFKQMKVMKEKSGEFPIFIGPLLLHDSCDVKSYGTLFNHIGSCLSETEKSRLVLSCDKEVSLVTALAKAFPEVTQLQTAKSVSEGKKQHLGHEGEKKAPGEQIMDLDEVIQAVDSISPDGNSVECSSEINQRISSELVEMSWMNEKGKPLHQVLKQCVRWRSEPLESLTSTLSKLIRSQYKELRKSLIGIGDFQLSKAYQQFKVSKLAWTSKCIEERDRHFQRFCSYIP